jgi:glutaminyl-tRNA synthetase
VLNRIVTLRDSYAEARPAATESAAAPDGTTTGPTEKLTSAKAKTRPKSKSPSEYRAEARARDPELAAAYAKVSAQIGAESADLLTGDLATARLFLAVAERARPETAAKWIINELPRALDESPGGRAGLEQIAAPELAALLAAVDGGSLSTNLGKNVLSKLIRTGKPFAELRADLAAPSADLGAAVEAVIAANPDKATQYRAGKTGLLGFFVGQVMKTTPGADAAAVNKLVRDRLS